jgi:hypothetical protein
MIVSEPLVDRRVFLFFPLLRNPEGSGTGAIAPESWFPAPATSNAAPDFEVVDKGPVLLFPRAFPRTAGTGSREKCQV